MGYCHGTAHCQVKYKASSRRQRGTRRSGSLPRGHGKVNTIFGVLPAPAHCFGVLWDEVTGWQRPWWHWKSSLGPLVSVHELRVGGRICPVADAVPLGSFGCWGNLTADSPCRQEIHVKWTRLSSRCLCKQLRVGVSRSGMKQGCLAREGPRGCSSASTFLSCGQGRCCHCGTSPLLQGDAPEKNMEKGEDSGRSHFHLNHCFPCTGTSTAFRFVCRAELQNPEPDGFSPYLIPRAMPQEKICSNVGENEKIGYNRWFLWRF